MSDTNTEYDLVAIGNALVDVLANLSEEFIADQHAKHGMEKGGMTLIDEERSNELYGLMGTDTEMSSGGSAGNTLAGFVSFGGKGAYIGKVADDQLGDAFKGDLENAGVFFETARLTGDLSTGRCLVLITPDAERTMNTFLGAATELGPDDIAEDTIAKAKVTYLEGYLFDKSEAKQAFYKAARLAKKAGRKVSLTLSDSFCVGRHREDFLDLVDNHVDVLFANADEIKSLYETEDLEAALSNVADVCEIAAITRGKDGAVILSGGKRIDIPAAKVEHVIDTTGAGDQYAAGFLYGYTQGYDLEKCGKLGALAAADVISHKGPRPQKQYSDFKVAV